MKLNWKEALKFLFPEWQVYDDYKKHGFIAKRKENKISTSIEENRQMKQSYPATNEPVQMYTPNIGNQQQMNRTRNDVLAKPRKENHNLKQNQIDKTFQMIRS